MIVQQLQQIVSNANNANDSLLANASQINSSSVIPIPINPVPLQSSLLDIPHQEVNDANVGAQPFGNPQP